MRTVLKRVGLTLLATAIAYGVLLWRPQLVFAYSVRAGNLVLHARTPLPPGALAIAASARDRVARSPLYDAGRDYHVFLCDTGACYTLFALWNRRSGGVSQVYLTGNAFLRPAHVERDRLVGYSGREADGDRTLTYFVAHEVTHTMTAARVGRLGYHRLAAWQQEGYADYVAKGGTGALDVTRAIADLRAGVPEMDPHRSGLYRRYHLLVAFLLERRGMTVPELLARRIDPHAVEATLALDSR
jgi:hypothetical protein